MSFTNDQRKYYRMRENNKKCSLTDDRIKAFLDAQFSFEPVKKRKNADSSRSTSRSNATLENNVQLPIYLSLLFTLIINTAILPSPLSTSVCALNDDTTNDKLPTHCDTTPVYLNIAACCRLLQYFCSC
eukprot:scaffold41854_cov234-Skeletonema_marinoi.AAC.1